MTRRLGLGWPVILFIPVRHWSCSNQEGDIQQASEGQPMDVEVEIRPRAQEAYQLLQGPHSSQGSRRRRRRHEAEVGHAEDLHVGLQGVLRSLLSQSCPTSLVLYKSNSSGEGPGRVSRGCSRPSSPTRSQALSERQARKACEFLHAWQPLYLHPHIVGLLRVS